jgi:hypothetical protein
MLKNPPTQKEIRQAQDVIRQSEQDNMFQRRLNETKEQTEKEFALALECDQLAKEIYEQIRAALPDDLKELFVFRYSFLVLGKEVLSHSACTDPRKAYSLYAQVVESTREDLDKS